MGNPSSDAGEEGRGQEMPAATEGETCQSITGKYHGSHDDTRVNRTGLI